MLGTNERKKKNYLALTLVSRQIYVETVLVPFKLNTFYAEGHQTLKIWAKQLPVAAQQSITRIQLSVGLGWHEYISYGRQHPHSRDPFPEWWGLKPKQFPAPTQPEPPQQVPVPSSSGSMTFDEFPALRQVCVLVTLARCYCSKEKPDADALIKHLEEAEDSFKELVKASY